MAKSPALSIGLDTSLPHIPVLMVWENHPYPHVPLPQGFSCMMYSPGMAKDWCRLHVETGMFDSEENAMTRFSTEFLPEENELRKRLYFVQNINKQIVGTGCLWKGTHFGDLHQRVHWVSVSPEFQGRGLAKAITCKALDLYREMGLFGPIYLTSQTWSYRGLAVYKQFGFRPYRGPLPEGWKSDPVHNDFENTNRKAWALIEEQWESFAKK